MSEDINIVYEINTNQDLILTSFLNGLEIGKTNAGNIEKILFKVKLYDEEYNNLINQNKLMLKIQEDYETKDKEIERLNNIINDKKERIEIAIKLLIKLFGTDDMEINYVIGILNGNRQIHFETYEINGRTYTETY